MRDNTYAETGFTDTDIGTSPDSVTIVSQCRGDTYGSKCHTCLDVAVAGLRKRCPWNKGRIICSHAGSEYPAKPAAIPGLPIEHWRWWYLQQYDNFQRPVCFAWSKGTSRSMKIGSREDPLV
ncbi:Gnk2-homologous domain protein [Raphanus sativus]|nr:Gnk2-homologous domain protein [Raphanus sativus]